MLDKVSLQLTKQTKNYNVQVVDISGKIVELFENINQNNFQIDMSKYNKGLYILKVYNDKV